MRTLADCRQSPAVVAGCARARIGADSDDPTFVARREAQLLIDEDDSPITAGPDALAAVEAAVAAAACHASEGQVFVLRPDGYLGYRVPRTTTTR